MKPTIAVVIPNFNDSETLKQCLDSVFEQDQRPEQVIVVDDQSTDKSLEILQACLRDVPVAKLIVNPVRVGTMAALNAGLEHVTADYALFLSANDFLKPGIFLRARDRIAADGYPGVWSAMVSTIDENGRRSRLYPSPVIACSDTFLSPEQCISMAVRTGHWFTGTTLVYHCETLRKIGGFDVAYRGLADMLAALTIASIKGASFSPEPFGVMRRHAGGLMTSTSTDLQGLDNILERMEVEGPKLSPNLFTSQFCDIMRRRIRFTAIRTFMDASWLTHARNWQGNRYRLLNLVAPLFGRTRSLRLAAAFILLRPPLDLFYIIWFRLLGSVFVMVRMGTAY